MNKPIDYESPSHQINEVLFDVKLQNIFANSPRANNLTQKPMSAPNHFAVVNQENGQILSVVGRNYRLIKNEEAIEMGKYLFCQIYPAVNVNELISYKVVAPATKASAHIDLIHKEVNFSVWEQETWLPFLRVTNSYNRSYALAFEIGFVRKLCSNGVLFNKRSMKIKYVHSNSKAFDFQNDVSKIGKVSGSFVNNCKQLRDFMLPEELMFAFVCHIMKLNLALNHNRQLNRKLNNLENLYTLTNNLMKHYSDGKSVNAYTAFNVVSDIVSHQNEYKNLTGFYFNVRSFYARPTDWMEEFTRKAQETNFAVDKYLEPTVKALDEVEKEVGFKWHLN